MSENIDLWELNLLNSIRDLSDLETQKRTWLGKHPELISSFTEEIGTLYDNFDFKRYIDYYQAQYGEDSILWLLKELDKQICDFKDVGYNWERQENGQLKILHDPRWIKITEIAKKIILKKGKEN